MYIHIENKEILFKYIFLVFINYKPVNTNERLSLLQYKGNEKNMNYMYRIEGETDEFQYWREFK